MMTFETQIKRIIKANEADFKNITYPIVINSGHSPWDIVDILAVIKDIDINKYMYMDTLARDYCIDICEKIIKENKKKRG